MKYTKDLLEPVVKASISFADVIRALGLRYAGGTYRHLQMRIRQFGLDTSHFKGRAAGAQKRGLGLRIHAEAILVLKSAGLRTTACVLRRALLEIGRPHVCEVCAQGPFWRGVPLVLEIDHRNGNRNDDRRENLRFLCPNCHSQTANFGAKNIEKKIQVSARIKQVCLRCGTVKKPTKADLCAPCAQKTRVTGRSRKVNDRPSFDVLQKEIAEFGYAATGRKYGVTGTSIRSWIKVHIKTSNAPVA